MKSEKLLREIGNIDDDLITDADKTTFKRKSKLGLKIMVPLAASIVVSLLFYNYNRVSTPPNIDNVASDNDVSDKVELAKITLDKIEEHGCGQTIGYAYNIKDITNGNPWSESYGITSLPVYKHAVDYKDMNNYTNGVLDKMKERATYIANKMGLKIDQLYTIPTDEQLKQIKDEYQRQGKEIPNGGALSGVVAVCGDIKITVSPGLSISIEFPKGIKLPSEYNFKYTSSIEDASKVIDYLMNDYKDIINMNNPKKSIPTYFDPTGQRYLHHDLYDASGDIYNQIKNYNFNTISFIPQNGMLDSISIGSPEELTTVGNYPIISLEEAKSRLYENKYYANVPGELPEEKYIGKVEIVYPYSDDTFVIPYYRFYVELPSPPVQLENGMKTYGIYDVPAVKTEYIDNISTLHAAMH